MAHEISMQTMSDGTQVGEAAFAGEGAWHGLGKVLHAEDGKGMNSEEAIIAANQDWETKKELMKLSQDDALVPDFYATVRQDTRKVLGIVGKNYQVIQNREAFNFLDSFIQDGVMQYESAISLFGGRQIVLLARMPSVDYVIDGDANKRYLMFSNSHDGSGSIIIQPTHVRVVCNNTHQIALRDKQFQVKIRHNGSMEEKLEIAKTYMSQFDERFTLFTEQGKHLASKSFSSDDVTSYLDQLFPAVKDASERQTKNRREKLDKLMDRMSSPANSLPGMRGTWWQVFNAVTESVDHFSNYKGGALERAENRFSNITEGAGAALKNKAMELALSFAV